MDLSGTLRLLFLLVTTNACLQGNPVKGHYDLHCVSDYLFTINCSLTIPPPEQTSDSKCAYWLTLTETTDEETFVCNLTDTSGNSSSCSVNTLDANPDSDIFTNIKLKISLCHKLNSKPEICEVLDEHFNPAKNIKPNAPCCLIVTHNMSQYHFTWESTYEEYSEITALVKNLKYQLHYYKRGDKHHVVLHDINPNTEFSVDDQKFMPGTEYITRVRSSPNKAIYQGQWSDWSSEVYWKTELDMNDFQTSILVSELGKMIFIPICVMVPLVLLLCSASVKKWRQSAFIPTPEPYFHTLYTDCQGDFKSWVVTQENRAEMLNAEETLQIDTLTNSVDVQEEEPQYHHELMGASMYSNITDHISDVSLLGIPYAISTMDPQSDPESSLKNMTLISQPGSPAEGDSGCWLCSDTTLEKDPPWYCNEYCTLNSFQQCPPFSTEQHGSLCSHEMIRIHDSMEA